MSGLQRELEVTTPDAWAGVLRSIQARKVVADLLAALDRPPSSHSRLGCELRLRVPEAVAGRAA